jgi:aminoglycoside 6'-N-acetyltransferase
MNITFRSFKDEKEEYEQIYKWCQNKFVYEWFEQRKLSLEEITNKYKNKLNKQELLIIEYDNKDIGLVQIYKFEYDIPIILDNVYEFDLFIGEKEYLDKGIGTKIVELITKLIYSKYDAKYIILRPFKRNKRAIKCYEKNNYKIINEYNGKDTLGNKEIITVLINKKNTKN